MDIVELDVHDIAALEQNDDIRRTDDSAKYSSESHLLLLPLTLYKRVC